MKEEHEDMSNNKEYTNVPKISVIMSVYNTKREWLCESIESILNQTYRNFEFIIILDCPTDDSEDVVKYYAKSDERIVVLQNKENIGLTKSLNRGLVIARGDYIARMDADDISLPLRFEKQLGFLEKHPNIAVVGARVFTPGINNAVQFQCSDDQEILRIRLLFFNAGVPHPTAFIRRSVLSEHKITYNEAIKKSQDYKLWIDIAPYGDIVMLPDILLLYRVHENQITAGLSSQLGYAQTVALEQAKQLVGDMSEGERLIHIWFRDPTHSEGGKKAYKAYIHRLIDANNNKNVYNKKKFKRELEFMWCQKAWQRAVLYHRFDFLLDSLSFVMIKPSMLNYLKDYKNDKLQYELTIANMQKEYMGLKEKSTL